MRFWNRYFYGPVAAARPFLLMKGVLILLAFDMWLAMTRRAPLYGATDFNVAHFRWLDAVQPPLTPAYHTGVLLLTGLLALFIALVGMSRLALAALCVLYTYCWAMSRLDEYTHHYLISWLLLCFVFFPRLTALDILRGEQEGKSHTSAWGFTMLGAVFGIVFLYCALAKADPQWRAGHTIHSMDGPRRLYGPLEQFLAANVGLPPSLFWRMAATGVLLVEIAIAMAYLTAVVQDRSRRQWIHTACWFGWGLTMALHIGNELIQLLIRWLSYYFMIMSCFYFLPERWLLGLVRLIAMPARWFDALSSRLVSLASKQRHLQVALPTAAVAIAGLLLFIGYRLDLPGGVVACGAAGVAVVGISTFGVFRASGAVAWRLLIGAGLSGVVMWTAIASSNVRYRFYLLRGEDLRRLRDVDGTARAYEKARRYAPAQDAQAQYRLGIGFQALGRVQEAIAHYERALEIEGEFLDARVNLGMALRSIEEYDRAMDQFRQTLDQIPSHPVALYNVANTHESLGKMDLAINGYSKLLLVDPDHDQGHVAMGVVLQAKGEHEKAADHYRAALRSNPRSVLAHNNLGTLLKATGDLDEAARHYRRAIQVRPDYVSARCNLGNVLRDQGQFDQALRHYQIAIKISPNDARVPFSLGTVYESMGQLATALTYYRQAVQLDSQFVEMRQHLAWILATHPDSQIRHPQEAIKLAEEASRLAKHPSSKILDTLAAAYAAAGRFELAVATAERALDLASGGPDPDTARHIREHLDLFRAKKPLLQSPPEVSNR